MFNPQNNIEYSETDINSQDQSLSGCSGKSIPVVYKSTIKSFSTLLPIRCDQIYLENKRNSYPLTKRMERKLREENATTSIHNGEERMISFEKLGNVRSESFQMSYQNHLDELLIKRNRTSFPSCIKKYKENLQSLKEKKLKNEMGDENKYKSFCSEEYNKNNFNAFSLDSTVQLTITTSLALQNIFKIIAKTTDTVLNIKLAIFKFLNVPVEQQILSFTSNTFIKGVHNAKYENIEFIDTITVIELGIQHCAQFTFGIRLHAGLLGPRGIQMNRPRDNYTNESLEETTQYLIENSSKIIQNVYNKFTTEEINEFVNQKQSLTFLTSVDNRNLLVKLTLKESNQSNRSFIQNGLTERERMTFLKKKTRKQMESNKDNKTQQKENNQTRIKIKNIINNMKKKKTRKDKKISIGINNKK